jgi:hypothetical protein
MIGHGKPRRPGSKKITPTLKLWTGAALFGTTAPAVIIYSPLSHQRLTPYQARALRDWLDRWLDWDDVERGKP